MAEADDARWWLHGPGDPDLDRMVTAVSERSWAVFAPQEADSSRPAVAMTFATSSDGRVVCTGLIVGLNEAHPAVGRTYSPAEVTSRALRNIPVAEMIGQAVANPGAPAHHKVYRDAAMARAPEIPRVRRSPGPKGHPDEHFRMVADLYRLALRDHPKAPIRWLTGELAADRSTVTRWVQRARDKGYLGAAVPGRAGEAEESR